MPQGPRGRWVRAVFTGVGALLCAGAIGCTGLDKPKDAKQATNTKQGLPGTPLLPGAGGNPAMAGRPAQPGTNPNPYATGPGAGIQQAGATTYNPPPTGRSYPQPNYSTNQFGGPNPAPSVAPVGYPSQPGGYTPPPGGYQGSTGGAAPGGFATGPGSPLLGDPGLVPPSPRADALAPGVGPISPATVTPPGGPYASAAPYGN